MFVAPFGFLTNQNTFPYVFTDDFEEFSEFSFPSDIVIVSGSYTIPSGKYGYVLSQDINGSTSQINSSVYQSSQNFDVARKLAPNSPINPARYAIVIGGSNADGVPVSPTIAANAQIGPAGASNGIGAEIGKRNTNTASKVWLDSGTLINATNCVVMLYNK